MTNLENLIKCITTQKEVFFLKPDSTLISVHKASLKITVSVLEQKKGDKLVPKKQMQLKSKLNNGI